MIKWEQTNDLERNLCPFMAGVLDIPQALHSPSREQGVI